jgi:hypothetical protein
MEQIYLNPVSTIERNAIATTVTTHGVMVPGQAMITHNLPYYELEFNSGLNDNYFAQQQMIEYMMAQFYNNWIYENELCYLLKYLKVTGNDVNYVSSKDEYKNNKICNDSDDHVEKKIDFIEKNILTKSDMKKILRRLTNDLGVKWFQLTLKENIAMETIERYVRSALKRNIN